MIMNKSLTSTIPLESEEQSTIVSLSMAYQRLWSYDVFDEVSPVKDTIDEFQT